MSTNNKDNNRNPAKDEDFVGGQNKQRPQYGKKGWKPRSNRSYKLESMDTQITNDPKYWNQAVTFDNVTKFTWPLIVGNTYSVADLLPSSVGELVTNGAYGNTPPAIMKITYVTGPGWADTTNSGVNRSLAAIMSRLRSSLSTSNIGFETASLGLFEASTASIPMCFAIAKRALRCRRLWKERNYAFPRAIISAMGFDFDDLLNVNYYAARLNAMIEEYNNLFIPDFSYVYDRHYTFANNIYMDEDSDFGQAYLFMPENVYVYRDTEHRAECKFIDAWIGDKVYEANGTISRFEAFLQIIQELIDAWKLSSDFFQINGVLRRALPDVPRQNVPLFSIEDIQSTVVDRAITMQIMNATILGYAGDMVNLDITFDPANPTHIIWKPKGTLGDMSTDKQLLRVFEDVPSADDNMEMTRLLNYQRNEGDILNPLAFEQCGDMLVRKVVTFVVDARTGTYYEDWGLTSNYVYLDMTGDNDPQNAMNTELARLLDGIMNVQNFRYIPTVHLIAKLREYVDEEGYTGPIYTKYVGLVGDVYNYQVYDFKDFKELQNSAFQSIWKPKFAI